MYTTPNPRGMFFQFPARPWRPPAHFPGQHLNPKRANSRSPGETLPSPILGSVFPPPPPSPLSPSVQLFPGPPYHSLPKPSTGSFMPAPSTKQVTADMRAERKERKKEKEEKKKKPKRRVCPHCDGCGYIEEDGDEDSDDDEDEIMGHESDGAGLENDAENETVEGGTTEDELRARKKAKAKRKKQKAETGAKGKDLAATIQEEMSTRLELPSLAPRSRAPEFVREEEVEGDGDTVVCPFECGFKTKSQVSLKSHVRKHTGQAFPCTHAGCYKQFTTVNGLALHMDRMHSGRVNSFACDYEGCTFATKHEAQLKIHKCKHTGERRFKCAYPDCIETFVTKYSLVKHTATHEDLSIEEQKPYKCAFDGCQYRTNYKGSLKTHVVIHSEDLPFVCTYCPAAFRRIQSLDKHLCVHTGQRVHKCPYPDCTYDTAHKTGLEIHIRQHTGDRPYKCERPDCKADFAKKENLKLHQKMHERKDREAVEAGRALGTV